MKRILSIILAVFMAISNTCVVFANEEVEFYAYTSDTSEFDEYAIDKFSSFLYGHYGYIDNTIELGKGITIFGETTYPTVLYPVWKDDNIIATFNVVNVNDLYSGTYTEELADVLNQFISYSSLETPIMLINDNHLFFKVGDDIYDGLMNIVDDLSVHDTNNVQIQKDITNVKENINFQTLTIPRAPTSYNNGWSVYQNDSTQQYWCYAYCLYNIFRNLGITDYTLNEIKSGIYPYILGTTDPWYIDDFLSAEGFYYYYRSSGYLSYSDIQSIIYLNDNYIMIGLTNQGEGYDHYMVLYGYSNISGIVTYSVWDPQSSGNGRLTLDANTRLITVTRTSGTITFKWDGGYFGKFEK